MQTPQRFYTLDALRGVAALAVVFWHWQNFFLEGAYPRAGFQPEQQPLYTLLRPLYDSGDRGVDLFFALSGFVFFWLYAEPIRRGLVSSSGFFWLRFSRLYPLHLLTLLVVAAGQVAWQAQHELPFVYPNNDGWHFVLHLMLGCSIGLETGHAFNAPVWSVSVEAALYLAFFLFCRRWDAKGGWLLLIALLGFFLLARFSLPLGRGVGAFFLGGCIYRLYLWMQGRPNRGRWTSAVSALAALLWGLTLWASWRGLSLADHPHLRILSWKYPVLVLFPVTILALALAETAHQGLGRRWSWLGDVSYSSYLWHFPLQLVIALLLASWGVSIDLMLSPWALLAFFALLLPFSLASTRWIERPTQSWLRQRLAQRSGSSRVL